MRHPRGVRFVLVLLGVALSFVSFPVSAQEPGSVQEMPIDPHPGMYPCWKCFYEYDPPFGTFAQCEQTAGGTLAWCTVQSLGGGVYQCIGQPCAGDQPEATFGELFAGTASGHRTSVARGQGL